MSLGPNRVYKPTETTVIMPSTDVIITDHKTIYTLFWPDDYAHSPLIDFVVI